MSQLVVNGCTPWSALTQQWAGALQDVVLRHPNGWSNVVLTLNDAPSPVLMIHLDETADSTDPTRRLTRFVISNVRLTHFPGVRLAREWLAAAWFGYIGHEALELVTIGGLVDRPLDPHEPPFWFDKSLRVGLPVELTPETLRASLCLVMDPPIADGLIARGGVG